MHKMSDALYALRNIVFMHRVAEANKPWCIKGCAGHSSYAFVFQKQLAEGDVIFNQAIVQSLSNIWTYIQKQIEGPLRSQRRRKLGFFKALEQLYSAFIKGLRHVLDTGL